MTSLKLTRVVSGDPFEEHPLLKLIWPSPYREIAQEAAAEDIEAMLGGAKLGGVFLARLDGEVVGISGYFPLEERSVIGLRWHGVAQEHRGKGLSADILRLVLPEALADFPDAEELMELAPANEYGKAIAKHFKKLGFEASGPQETYDWAENAWQPYRLNIAAFMREPRPSKAPKM